MKYVLGIDSGGTKYLVRAAGLDGTPLGCDIGPAANHYMQPYDEVVRLIGESIDRCLAQFGGRREDCAYLVSGSTGVDSEEDQELIDRLYRSLPGFACPVHCVNDGELAHYTATGGEGVLLIAGTGSIAVGRKAPGDTQRVGGWPMSVMGDEGSGRYVDAWAMRHYTRYLDGVRERSPLIEHIERVTNVRTSKEMMDYAMAMFAPPWPTPRLGQAVSAAADEGDIWAREILDRAAACNFDLLSELAKKLGYAKSDRFKVGLWGSTIVKGSYQRAQLTRLMLEEYPNAEMVIASRDAAQGAVAWAIERLSSTC